MGRAAVTVYFRPKALKVFEALGLAEPKLARVIRDKLKSADDRRNLNEMDVKRLAGTKHPRYRLRVGGWRVEFELGKDELVVTYIDKRGQLYK